MPQWRFRAACLMPFFTFFLLSLWASPRVRALEGGVEGTWRWSYTDGNGTEHKRALRIGKKGDSFTAVLVGEEGRETRIKDVKIEGSSITLSDSREQNGQTSQVRYSGKIEGDGIVGTVEAGSNTYQWEPRRDAGSAADGWVPLIRGESLSESGWRLRKKPDEKHRDGWTVNDGVLRNKAPSIDIVQEKLFKDFELHVEFKIPKGSNSGVYLRGIYEVQIEDNYGKDITPTICGSIYNQMAPSENATLPPGEWQTFDITLAANKVTVIHNKKKVIDGFELKGPTGGAYGIHEGESKIQHGEPGPIMLQGDHGDVEFRNVRIRPLKLPS